MEHRKKAHNYFARPVVRILAAAAAAHAVVVDAGNVSVPKSCEICAISFSASRQFHDHMVTHLDKVSYFCNICGQRFKLAGPLKVLKLTNSFNRYSGNNFRPLCPTASFDRTSRRENFDGIDSEAVPPLRYRAPELR